MKKVRICICILVIAALLAAAGYAGYRAWYENNHIFVGDAVYQKDLTYLDLRGTGVSLEHYESVRSQLPDCEIRYDMVFQGTRYPDDTQELAITSLTEEEILLLDYLPELSRVRAEGCRDYEELLALQQRRPDCNVSYTVAILGEEYPENTKVLSFFEETPGAKTLSDALAYLPEVESIFLNQPHMSAEELLKLCEDYPDIAFSWEKDALGATYNSDLQELDLSGRKELTLEQIAEELAYFPKLEMVDLSYCGYDNETMAAFREQMRPQYKVVWTMSIYGLQVRTDDTYFMPVKYDVDVRDYQLKQLIYCEDMLCVDLGHMPIRSLEWVKGMPHLKYLIVADGPLLYIDPLSTCKELVYLELFETKISDFTPLLGCTALQDLNVADTNGDVMVFAQMPWLKNLWINLNGVTQAEHDALQEALPNTHIESKHGWATGAGWRQLENYFGMRDLLEMPYNRW